MILQSPKIRSWDYSPYDVPSQINLQSPDLSLHSDSTSTRAESREFYSHKRRNTEPDLCTLGLVCWNHLLDGPVKRRHLRSSSLDRGSAIYNTWVPESFQRGAAVLLEKDIPETSPHDIALLWNIVSMPLEAEENHQHGVSTRANSKGKKSEISQSEVKSNPTTTSKKGKNQKTLTGDYESLPPKSQGAISDAKRVSPYNTGFDVQILAPRSIRINLRKSHGIASAHFNVAELPAAKNRRQYYSKDRGVADSTVWVESDDSIVATIVKNYNCMVKRGMCEAAFATYAKETLLKQDALLLNNGYEDDRSWRTERMVELVAKPGQDINWASPPLIEDPISATDLSTSNYAFDLRPDCSYWLSLQAFNPRYQSQIGDWTFVMYEELTCPYFTIEFKKDNFAEARAKSQLASAASVALYNRYRLREMRLEEQKTSWTKKLTTVLRHYGLTLKGHEFTVWLIKPTLSKYQWAGCEMTAIGHGFCTKAPDVRDLIDWINEIHCWGLTCHGPRCAKDVKYILQAREKRTGYRPSDIARDSEDGSDSEDESAPQ